MEVQVIFALSLAIFFFNGAGPQLSSTGFELATQASLNLNVPPPWSGRFWGRTHCVTTDSKFQCATADCGSGQITCNGGGAIPPASLIEFTLAPNNGKDFYDISLVDGFNLPLAVTPHGRLLGCNTTSCAADVNTVCPSELQVKGLGGGNSPATCQPTKYSKIFKSQCPQAYSYAYDDKTSTFTCTGGANYLVTFCP
ncbi:hypothetical protein V6Z12_D01G158500 [Gossypium hirsutum]